MKGDRVFREIPDHEDRLVSTDQRDIRARSDHQEIPEVLDHRDRKVNPDWTGTKARSDHRDPWVQ